MLCWFTKKLCEIAGLAYFQVVHNHKEIQNTVYVGFEVLTVVTMKSSRIQCDVVCWKSTDVLEEHVTVVCSSETSVDF
jgi:hypothetical protein